MKIFLVLFLGLKFAWCGAKHYVPFEDGELLAQSTSRVRLGVSENIPRIRKGPHCTNFYIEWKQEDIFRKVGVIETKLHLKNISGSYLRIAFITVTSEYRDQGIGSEALKILISYCKDWGHFSYFEAEVAPWDTGYKTNRVPFYERLGFAKHGYVDEAVIMHLKLEHVFKT